MDHKYRSIEERDAIRHSYQFNSHRDASDSLDHVAVNTSLVSTLIDYIFLISTKQ